jgi:hypothetical protein
MRCRNCGAIFSSSRPQKTDEYRARKALEKQMPQLRRRVVWLFIFCIIPLTAPFAALFGGLWYLSNRDEIAALPALFSAVAKLSIYVAIGQTSFLFLTMILFAAITG